MGCCQAPLPRSQCSQNRNPKKDKSYHLETAVTNESKMADDELEKLRSQRMAELRSQLQVCSHLGLLATGIDVTLCAHSTSGWGRERGRRKGEGRGHAQVSHCVVHWRLHPLRYV